MKRKMVLIKIFERETISRMLERSNMAEKIKIVKIIS